MTKSVFILHKSFILINICLTLCLLNVSPCELYLEKLNSIIAYSDLIFEKEIIERLTSVESDISLAIDNISQNSDSFSDYVKTRNKPLRDGRILTQNRSNEILGLSLIHI